MRVRAVNPQLGPSGDGSHLWSTTDDGRRQNQALLIPKGWTRGLVKTRPEGSWPGQKPGLRVRRRRGRHGQRLWRSQTLCPNVGPASASEEEKGFDFDLFIREALSRGDVTGEGQVDIFDLAFLAARFHAADSQADINGDGRVDMLDLAVAAQNYGQGVTGPD